MTAAALACNNIPDDMATIAWLLTAIFAQVMVIFYPGVLVFWLVVHNQIARLRPFGIKAYWVAAVAWLFTSGPLILFRRGVFSVLWAAPRPFSAILTVSGVATFGLAAFIMLQASRQISFRIMVGLPEIEPQKNKQIVLHQGIYSRTRNPIYLAHWLFVFSSAALTGFAANWIGFALDCLILPLMIRAEEKELLARHGQNFADYMRRVPRFFPQLR